MCIDSEARSSGADVRLRFPICVVSLVIRSCVQVDKPLLRIPQASEIRTVSSSIVHLRACSILNVKID